MSIIDRVMEVSDSLEAMMIKGDCPMSDRQLLLLRGALMVWIPKLEDAAVREFSNFVDEALKKHGN